MYGRNRICIIEKRASGNTAEAYETYFGNNMNHTFEVM